MELVAIDQWTNLAQPCLVGAVTTGDIWRFGVLERSSKHVTQGLNVYRVTEDLEELMQILLAVLMPVPLRSNGNTSSVGK